MNDTAEIFSVLTRFPRDEVVHALPALTFDLVRAAPSIEVPNAVACAVRDWMQARGLAPNASADDVLAALEEFYGERPIHHELRLALAEVLRSVARGSGGSSFRSFLGDRSTVPLRSSAPGKGALKATPLARFALQSTKKPN